MKYKFSFVLIVLLAILSCKNDETQKTQTAIIPEEPYIIPSDSIPERTKASALNLEKYQLFIDTTKTSKFYENLASEVSSEIKNQAKAIYQFIELKKYNDRFVIYKPCKGKVPRYYISKEKIVKKGNLENIEYPLKDFMLSAGNRVLFKDEENVSVSLKEINEQVVRLKYDQFEAEVYLTSVENLRNFEMMINNCLGEKVREFDNFQE
ncbi:hypothetical protein [Zunongwangia endophytica]|uniref:DUF4468 domain-containing protein n=1 Tax=Zunongwangia endophytica TaxID=1808945 RepID=A0ABV8H713_9FLAO|nr:hypothetical protein [Zunongwangia endophytica]MDN3595802.1 hypothetical protein [Zunongwangia endophytica]